MDICAVLVLALFCTGYRFVSAQPFMTLLYLISVLYFKVIFVMVEFTQSSLCHVKISLFFFFCQWEHYCVCPLCGTLQSLCQLQLFPVAYLFYFIFSFVYILYLAFLLSVCGSVCGNQKLVGELCFSVN